MNDFDQDEGILFANVLAKKKVNKKSKQTMQSETKPLQKEKSDDLFAPTSAKAQPKQSNLFSKVRNNTMMGQQSGVKSSQDPNEQIEESKNGEGANRYLDNLFAPAADGRKTTYGNNSQRKRGLSESFMGKVNQNHLVEKVKKVGVGAVFNKDPGNEDGKHSRRNSVSSNIALFQNVINIKSGRSVRQDSNEPKIKRFNANVSDVDSHQGGRNSAKDLVLAFKTGLASEHGKDVPKARKLAKKKVIADDVQSRNSLGDAFLDAVNRDISHQQSDAVGDGSHSFRSGQKFKTQDRRLSVGDQFMVNIKKNQELDNQSQQSNLSRERTGNIFNKARALQKASGIKSPPAFEKEQILGEAESSSTKKSIFKKKEGLAIVNRDDGGIGGDLITEDQMMNNLISGMRKQAKNDTSAVGTRSLHNLNRISSPHNPETNNLEQNANNDDVLFASSNVERNATDIAVEPIKPLFSVNKPQDNKYTDATQDVKRPKKVKKLGAAIEKKENDVSTGRSQTQPAADIIVYKPLGAPAPATQDLVVAETNVKGKEGGEFQMAVSAEPRNKRQNNRMEQDHHAKIGAMVVAQEQEHVISAREFKLEHVGPSARKVTKISTGNNVDTLKQSEHIESEPQLQHITENTLEQTLERTKKTNLATANSNNQNNSRSSIDQKELTAEQTRIADGLNVSCLFAAEEGDEGLQRVSKKKTRNRQRRKDMSQSFDAANPNDTSIVSESKLGRLAQHQSFLQSSSSKHKNNDFIEYVVGANTLLPKRIKSKKSDLPYSKGSRDNSINKSLDAADMLDFQQQIVQDSANDHPGSMISSRGRPKKTRGGPVADDVLSQSEDLPQNDKMITDPDNIKSATDSMKYMSEKQVEQLQADLVNSQGKDSSSPDEDDDDLDEVERRIAEQERMLNEIVEGQDDQDVRESINDQDKGDEDEQYQLSNQALAQYLEESKNGDDFNASGPQQDRISLPRLSASKQFEQLQHELELEELQKEEQRKLEQALQQAYEDEEDNDDGSSGDQTIPSQIDKGQENNLHSQDRSNPDFGVDMSNIQYAQKNDSSIDTSSVMQDKIDALEEAATSAQKNQDNTASIKETPGKNSLIWKSKQSVSGAHNVSSVADTNALRNNYLEKSQIKENNSKTDISSVIIEQNNREKQLRYELEILELELELQMNEAELSEDDDSDPEGGGISSRARDAFQQQLQQNAYTIRGGNSSKSKKMDSYNNGWSQAQSYEDAGRMGVQVNAFDEDELRIVGRPKTQSQFKARDMGQDNNELRQINKTKSGLTDVDSQWGLKQLRHDKIVMPINLEDQEVLCSNCYETIPMSLVDKHSSTCQVDELPSFRGSARRGGGAGNQATVDEEQEYQTLTEEINERIFKLIQTFLRKLDSQVFLDQIYTTHGNEEVDSNENSYQQLNQQHLLRSAQSEEERGGKIPTQQESRRTPKKKNNFQPNKSATALAEERSLIHEVVQYAHLALQGELHDLQNSAEQLDQLEEEHDLNQKLDFNNHMVYNRIVQVINIKLEIVQDWEKKANPDIVVPLTTKQIRERVENINFGFQELSVANVRKLPLQVSDDQEQLRKSQKTNKQPHHHERKNSQEQQLYDYVQAARAQALQQRKRSKNIFQNKKAAQSGQNAAGVAENWILSDMGSDTQSVGGDSMSSYSSVVSKPRFQSALKFNKQ